MKKQQVLLWLLGISISISSNICNATGISDEAFFSDENPAIDGTGYDAPISYPGYHLVWSDEFNGDKLETKDWNYETGGGGWGNNELQYYTNSNKNSYLQSGYLVIEARSEKMGKNNYTSARLTTQKKHEFLYGRIDIRAKLPVAKGMWPALWGIGANYSKVGWPACGEIDIMELVGKNPKQITGSFHWKSSSGLKTFNNRYTLSGKQDFSQDFHVFSLVWTSQNLQILVDDLVYVSMDKSAVTKPKPYPFDSPFFLIFNVAVGGDWPGSPDSSTGFPQRMYVDYVRVFQKDI